MGKLSYNKTIKFVSAAKDVASTGLPTCHIPDDCTDSKRYPLFMASAFLYFIR